ncbi:MAG: hypothetical protein ACAI25_14900 [Planctomycetota bacterium]
MRTDRPVRVGVFRDSARARRVVEELVGNGFRHVTVVTDDPVAQASFRNVCTVRGRCVDPVHLSPSQTSLAAAGIGACVGVIAWFIGVYLFRNAYGPPGAILNVAIPLAGFLWGAFIGAMVSRAWQGEVENFFDQDLQEGEMLVAVQDKDPGRLVVADRILSGAGGASIALTQG